MLRQITVLPNNENIAARDGENLLDILRRAGFFMDAVCGGTGTCGKCRVWIDGQEALACRTVVDRDMTVRLPNAQAAQILTDGIVQTVAAAGSDGFCLAFDIGTTTVAGYLLDGNGQELSCESVPRPDSAKLIAISHVESLLNSFGKSLYFGNSQLTDKMVISALDSAHDPVSFNSVVMDIFQEMESLFGNPGYKRRSIIDEMTEYIEKNFSNPNLNVNGICDHFGYNPSYISRIYKLSTGNGLLESIHRCRIIRAKELLQNTNLSVDQIFQDVGYSNRRTFDRAFKQQVGLSPAGYRAILPGKNP